MASLVINNHGTADGFVKKNAPPGQTLTNAFFVQDDKLKLYCYGTGKVYIWNESDDSFTEEFDTGQTYNALNFFDTGNGIYAYGSRTVYKYTGTSLEQIAAFDKWYDFAFAYDGHIYFTVSQLTATPYEVHKYNPVTKKFVASGSFPRQTGYTNTHVWEGKLRLVSGNYNNGKEGFSCSTLMTVDEPDTE